MKKNYQIIKISPKQTAAETELKKVGGKTEKDRKYKRGRGGGGVRERDVRLGGEENKKTSRESEV